MLVSVQYSIFRASALVLLAIALIAVVCGGAVSADMSSSATTLSNDDCPVSILPVRFIPNTGQFDDSVSFAVICGRTTLTFMPDSLTVHTDGTRQKDSGDSAAIVQTWKDANPHPLIEGIRPQENTASFFFGSDPSRWCANLTTYSGIVYRNLYPRIDCVYRDADGRIKREFVVAPGANPSAIRVHYDGITGISVDTNGALVITTPTGIQTESTPVGFQMIDKTAVPVPVSYQLRDGNDVGFEVGAYDPTVPLTIDPQLLYSTYLGGSDNEGGNRITLDAAGNIYVTGTTSSPDFPITKDAQSPNFSESATGSSQMFVAKLNAATHQLVYSTYLGGRAGGYNPCIAVDSSGSVFLTGKTNSADFPTTPGAYSRTGGGIQDIFVTRIDPSGSSLVYSTLIGGSIGDGGAAIAVDEEGNAFVAGTTYSSDFPTTTGAYQQNLQGSGDAFVLKLNPEGTNLIYATRLGGTGHDEATDIVLEPDGAVIVTGTTGSDDFPTTAGTFSQHRAGGTDVFAAKISPSGSDLLFATYIGGSGDDEAVGCVRCPGGNITIAGNTRSTDFPAPDGAFQLTNNGTTNGFVACLNATGTGILAATLLGGTERDEIRGITVDADGDVYVTGVARSPDFPTTNGAYQQTFVKESNAFVVRLNAPLTVLSYATFLGEGTYSTGTDITAAGNGTVWMTGKAAYTTFPITPDAQFRNKRGNSDAFIAKMLCENFADAGFTARMVNDTPPATLIFNATPGTTGTSWRWDFGDGTGASGQNTTHTFTCTGTYPVIVFAKNRAGETSGIRTFEIGLTGNQSQSVSLRELPLQTPELTLSVISGEPIEVHGTAHQPWSSAVRIWMFGPNAATVTKQQLRPDRSYSYNISPEKTRTFTNTIYTIVVQEPGPNGWFGITYNATSDEVTSSYRNTRLFRLATARSMQTDNSAGSLIRAITDPVSRDSCTIYQVVAEQPWIEIDPMGTAQKNTIRVSGITNLPEGERLGVHVMTTVMHPTPRNYDWSHERAKTDTTVAWVNATTRGFSCTVNTSLLRPGTYFVEVSPHSDRYDVETTQVFNLLPEPSPTLLPQNPIDWEDLNLPELAVNRSMEPVLLTHQVVLVPADERTKDYEIPYGAVLLFSTDGIVRLFDEKGTQIAAFYDSNALGFTQVPNGAMVSTEEYVTSVSLGGTRILTKIHEADRR